MDHLISLQFSSSDCFELGKRSIYNNNTGLAFGWFLEALSKYKKETQERKASKMKEISFPGKRNVTFEMIIMYLLAAIGGTNNHSYMGVSSSYVSIPRRKKYFGVYKKLCRDEALPAVSQLLKCYYWNTSTKPYLRLTWIKVELLSEFPKIILFHDIMSNSELEILQNISSISMKRSEVYNDDTINEIASYRVSESTWLNENDYSVVKVINQRIEDITGLSLETAEELHVTRYTFGGHYVPHHDFFMDFKESLASNDGNRIATWLMYLSDVEAGGATVYPILNLKVNPQKGTALFWYNLKNDGSGDYDTFHGACPVLIGRKWIATKWIHERGQEFIRQCDLRN
ncbi:prolyl 4-hydroxylase subunit alpha-1-like protein [Leptotrombidium deliense]|uniref:Prolyl 4-hydroxylase subunit alpha-1-like protein n=1 Tax=Leptotrombidium deliense TaxID=299467 RepID=A0A443RYX4_9ACAR|nr:prolyl 4-hydroxylase subunit alpha-1-like protein [Leptotrombidium deliense]